MVVDAFVLLLLWLSLLMVLQKDFKNKNREP